MSKKAELKPLQELLDSILSRLDVLESKVGVATSPSKIKPDAATPHPSVSPVVSPPLPPPPPLTQDDFPAVNAYNVLLETSVAPLADACNALQGMQQMGQLLQDAWTSIRTIIIIASKAKKPENLPTELEPHLKETQSALEAIRKLRLDRQYDDHCKAILESCAALSWILISPTPVAFVKEASSSTEFWSNRIRKTHKGNDQQMQFCNALQNSLRDLMSYITEYHKTGLEWNPRGVSLAEAAIVVVSSPVDSTIEVPLSPRPFVAKVSGGSGGVSSLVAELESKRTADGSSAATGLKHVRIFLSLSLSLSCQQQQVLTVCFVFV
jgi:adenylyl cyclase-associated protein